MVPGLLNALAWAAAILAVGSRAASTNGRTVFNAAVTLGAVRIYTRWFERLEQSAMSLIIAGVIEFVLVWGTFQLSNRLKKRDNQAKFQFAERPPRESSEHGPGPQRRKTPVYGWDRSCRDCLL